MASGWTKLNNIHMFRCGDNLARGLQNLTTEPTVYTTAQIILIYHITTHPPTHFILYPILNPFVLTLFILLTPSLPL